jgi:hypothetical protein
MFKTILAVALISAFARTAGAATTDARYPGSLCQVPPGTDGLYSEAFGVYNAGTNPVVVECPVPFDYANSPSLQVLVSFVAYDRNTTSDVSCRFMNADPDGGNAHFTGLGHTTGGAAFPSQTISLGAVNITNQQLLSMQCTIPPNQAGIGVSHLVSYRVQQSP